MLLKTEAAPRVGVRQSDTVSVWWLIAVVGVAVALRIPGLNSSLWIDEIFSLLDSFRGGLAQIVTVFPGDNQHPLYAVLAHLCLALFGESPWAIRLPAVVFGVATVPALYWLGSMVLSRREGLVSALLLSVSYHHIWFSQNARGYSALAFLTVVSTACLIRGLRGGPKSSFAWYAVTAALGCYVHLTMVFVVIAHAFVWVTSSWLATERVGKPVFTSAPGLGFVGAGALTLALYAPVFLQVQHFFVNKPSQLLGVSTPGWALVEGLRVLAMGIGGGSAVLGALLIVAGAAFFVIGSWSLWRQAPLPLGLFVMPAVVTILGALVARGTMYPRFFFSLIGFGVLIVVRGLVVVSRGRDRWMASLAGLAVIASLASLPLNYRYPKQDFDGARRWIDARNASREPVASVGTSTSEVFRRYLGVSWETVVSGPMLHDLRAAGPVWVVYTFPRYIDRALVDQLQAECPVQAVFPGTVGGGDIIVGRCPQSTARTSTSGNASWRS
jgi:hypothetical protein